MAKVNKRTGEVVLKSLSEMKYFSDDRREIKQIRIDRSGNPFYILKLKDE